jgi:hypothetical protein
VQLNRVLAVLQVLGLDLHLVRRGGPSTGAPAP